MAEHLSINPQKRPKRLFAIIKNGFPEAHHNAVALGICRQFAADTGMIWSGGLAMGGGIFFNGQTIEEIQRKGLPVKHVIQALDKAYLYTKNTVRVSKLNYAIQTSLNYWLDSYHFAPPTYSVRFT